MAKLKEMEEDFHVMDWPGNLSDLNPIENCCAYMNAELKMNMAFTSLPMLVEAIKLMWGTGPAPVLLPESQQLYA
jgi:hypothetical protein